LGAGLLDAAREAFIQGVHLSAAISVIGAIGLAIFVAVFLRRRVPTAAEPMDDDELEHAAEDVEVGAG
jgi:hypothetical protein